MLESRTTDRPLVRKARVTCQQFPGGPRGLQPPRRVYQGVRVRNTVKELLAAAREEGGPGRRPRAPRRAHAARPHTRQHQPQDSMNYCTDFGDIPCVAHCPQHPPLAGPEGPLYGTQACPGLAGLPQALYPDCLPPEASFQYCDQPAAYVGELGLAEAAASGAYGLAQLQAFHGASAIEHLHGLDEHHHNLHNHLHNHLHSHLNHSQDGDSGMTYTARVFEAPLLSSRVGGYSGGFEVSSSGGPSAYSPPQAECRDGLLDLSMGHGDTARDTLPEGCIFGAISTCYGFAGVEGQSSPDSTEDDWMLGSSGSQHAPLPHHQHHHPHSARILLAQHHHHHQQQQQQQQQQLLQN